MKIARWMLLLMLLGGFAVAAEPASAAHVRVRPSVHVYWGPGWAWYDPWWSYGPRWGGYPVVYPNATYGSYGALDTDISPERAEVWVDGRKVGLADDFDGFPNYLWLEKGTYDVVFYLPGHVTLARQYTIYPGLVVDVEDLLATGEATHPLELGPKSHERRDARLRDDELRRENWERRRGIAAEEAPEPGVGAASAPSSSAAPPGRPKSPRKRAASTRAPSPAGSSSTSAPTTPRSTWTGASSAPAASSRACARA